MKGSEIDEDDQVTLGALMAATLAPPAMAQKLPYTLGTALEANWSAAAAAPKRGKMRAERGTTQYQELVLK
jgi:hypothetical protein